MSSGLDDKPNHKDAADSQRLSAGIPRRSPRMRPSQERLKRFQYQNHSLRISASNVAALAGFHPWKNLPEILLELVYQGFDGQALLDHDAALLGVKMVSKQEMLLDLASKAGKSTTVALLAALDVKTGTTKVVTVDAATKAKQLVADEAAKTGKLAARELALLKEGARSAVDTGYGIVHENEALDLYGELCGWEVRERNREIRSWAFARDDTGFIPTVRPLSSSASTLFRNERGGEPNRNAEGRVMASDRHDDDDAVVDLTSNDKDKPESPIPHTVPILDYPFFSILGSVDGIREELVPSQSEADDDSWYLRRVVVECKHRMSRIHSPPPLYEQIQSIVYCFMYDTLDADILQVMRKEKGPMRESKDTSETANAAPAETKQTLDRWITPNLVNEEGRLLSEKAGTPAKRKIDPVAKPVLHAHRVSLDDPIMQHRKHFSSTILSRLRSFVEAVYSVRNDDSKRYSLLLSASDPMGTMDVAWKILHIECPWLVDCDTAFHRTNTKSS